MINLVESGIWIFYVLEILEILKAKIFGLSRNPEHAIFLV
jgi:hypothetical protein